MFPQRSLHVKYLYVPVVKILPNPMCAGGNNCMFFPPTEISCMLNKAGDLEVSILWWSRNGTLFEHRAIRSVKGLQEGTWDVRLSLNKVKITYLQIHTWASQVVPVVENLPARAEDVRDGFDPWVKKIPWKRAWQCTPVILPGESHGQRSLKGSGPWGWKDSDMTGVTEHVLGKERL